MVQLAIFTSLLLISVGITFGAPTIKKPEGKKEKSSGLNPLSKGKIGNGVYYNAEAKFVYNQKPHPLKGSKFKPHYGLLPTGTEGDMEDHDDIAALVVGDSFASPLAGVFNDIAIKRGVKFVLTSHPSCAAFFDKVSMDSSIHDWPNSPKQQSGKIACKAERRHEMLDMIKRSKAKIVFLAANWEATPQIWQVGRMTGDEKELDPVSETLIQLSKTGKKIVLFGVIPGAHIDPRACLARDHEYANKMNWFGCAKESNIAPPFRGKEKEISKMKRRVEARKLLTKVLARKEVKALNVEFIDPLDSMCNSKDKCIIIKGKIPLYADSMHLTVMGGKMMRSRIEKALDRLKATSVKMIDEM